MTTQYSDDESQSRKRRGRPRIWASEAERKRAYRERKARELAAPELLRQELRNERRRVAYRDAELAQLRRELVEAHDQLSVAKHRQSELEGMVENLRAKVDDWRGRARALATYREERTQSNAAHTRGPTG